MAEPRTNGESTGWLLAIDTSTEQAGLSLTDGERTAELLWPAGRTHTVTVLPQIEHLLRLCGTARDTLGAVAVATGPGTFTGLRVGLSIAKGLAMARDLPLIGVPTLDIAAAPYAAAQTPVVVVLAAGRGRIVWAAYGHDGGFGLRHGPVNTLGEALVDWLRGQPPMLVVGELDAGLGGALRAAGHSRVQERTLSWRRPSALAAIGWRRWQAGEVDDAASLEPVYLHAARGATTP